MTDNFNFLGLPLVVQELITNEIVHNSIPEDRIQLALTSKYCNELVQRAKPKKIIDDFSIWYHPRFDFFANSRIFVKTEEELMEILPNCQIKHIQLCSIPWILSEHYLRISDMLFEAARFATKLDILRPNLHQMDEIVGFYTKLKHLKSVTVGDPELILPFYPSELQLKFDLRGLPGNFLEDLAEKSQNCPLSFLELDCNVSLEKYQQFLQAAKFSIGADIWIGNDSAKFPAYLTYLGQNIFTFEMFLKNSMPIIICQKFVGENRRILKLKRTTWLLFDIAFKVVSASNLDKNYYSGVFKAREQNFVLENVDRDEILKVKFVDKRIKRRDRGAENFPHPRYSAAMLESAFPTANFTTPDERVEKINNVLGTNIQLIQADNFAQTVEIILQDS